MKILGVTQGSNLRVFLRLAEMLKEPLGLQSVSAYVSDSQEYHEMEVKEPQLRDAAIPLLKEWEITLEGLARQPDLDLLRIWEAKLGDPVLWNVLLADRRIFFGRMCKLRQDYKPRYSHSQMLSIAQVAAERIDHFLDLVRPDVILGFGTSTFGDYLLYRFARARSISYLQLKSTKIGNYVSLNDDAVRLSQHIAALTENPAALPSAALETAKKHLAQIRERGIRYEGAVKSTRRLRPLRGLIGCLRGIGRDFKNRLHPVIGQDNHVESAFLNSLYAHIIQPIKSYAVMARLKGRLVGRRYLKSPSPYAFFPLHFEPEVSLQVFGRPFQNQIELIRNLALNLPAGMDVLVKEHPRALGFRPYSYYRKLLDIPNVKLVDPGLSTHFLIRHAALVAVISGSTGLEGAVMGKPVILFGLPNYRLLPRNMIRQIVSLHELGIEIRDLMVHFRSDEVVLEKFFAAHIAGAVSIDLYNVLLSKPSRYMDGSEYLSETEHREQHYRKLAEYCCLRIKAEIANYKKHVSKTPRI